MRKHHWIFLIFIVLIALQPYYVGWVNKQYEHIFGPIERASLGSSEPHANLKHCEELTGDQKIACQKGNQ